MNEGNPYSKLILSKDHSKWKKFALINEKLQLGIRNEKDILSELFALYLVLNTQYHKWYVIASNKVNTNSQTKKEIEQLLSSIKANLSSFDIQILSNHSFIFSSFFRIVLQTLQLDVLYFGDVLRTNEKDTSRWLELHRNFGLVVLNGILFYGIPALLIWWHPYLFPILLISIIGNFIFAYRRTKLFYFENQLEILKTQPNKK